MASPGVGQTLATPSDTVAEAPVPDDAIQPPLEGSTDPRTGDGAELPILDFASPDGPAAIGYAKAHGVTPEEAASIIRWQGEVNIQTAQLAKTMGDRYVGGDFLPPEENGGRATVDIYIANPTPDDVAAVGRIPGASLVEAIAGRAELDRLVNERADAELRSHPDAMVGVTIDPATGNMDVKVEEVTPATTLVCTPHSNETGGKLDGGRSFTIKDGNPESAGCAEVGCTLAFSSYFNGKQGVLTAAHCVDYDNRGVVYNSNHFVNSGSSDWWSEAKCQNQCNGLSDPYSWASIRPYYRRLLNTHDFAFMRETFGSTAPSDDIYVANVGFYNIYGFEGDASFPSGHTVLCYSAGKYTAAPPGGVGPGQHCGEVDIWVHHSSTSDYWTSVDMYQPGNVFGASGSPFYRYLSSSQIIGMGVLSSQNADGSVLYYERIDPILDAMRTAASAYVYCNYGYGMQLCSANQ